MMGLYPTEAKPITWKNTKTSKAKQKNCKQMILGEAVHNLYKRKRNQTKIISATIAIKKISRTNHLSNIFF